MTIKIGFVILLVVLVHALLFARYGTIYPCEASFRRSQEEVLSKIHSEDPIIKSIVEMALKDVEPETRHLFFSEISIWDRPGCYLVATGLID